MTRQSPSNARINKARFDSTPGARSPPPLALRLALSQAAGEYLLRAEQEYHNAERLPSEARTVPLSELASRRRNINAEQFPSEAGMVPVSELLWRSILVHEHVPDGS